MSMIKSRTYKEEKTRKKKTVIRVVDIIEVDNYDMEQRVRAIIYLKQLDIIEVSKAFGTCNEQRFIGRCKTGKLNFAEQREIAKILGVDIVIRMVIDDHIIEADTVKEMIEEACRIKGESISELSGAFEITKQAMSRRLSNGRFTHEELDEFADHFDGRYYNYFVMDGIKF